MPASARTPRTSHPARGAEGRRLVEIAGLGVDSARSSEEAGVAVTFARLLRNLSIADTDAEGVVRASGDEAFERHAPVGVEADEVAVRGAGPVQSSAGSAS